MPILKFTAQNARGIQEDKKLLFNKRYGREIYKFIISRIKEAVVKGETSTYISCWELEQHTYGYENFGSYIIRLLIKDGYKVFKVNYWKNVDGVDEDKGDVLYIKW